ncbi:uncharacterized protein BDV17DRAFT_269173 [Aspergillus undulatus]|uniref:uncharacterized protein n=1 Tax=Aspergillus undulatus TaxID=1810928 RepID=UPI003CCDB54A
MPPLPGEERVLTIFADIHYYFTTPVPKPHLHRFDKGSYLYLYHNAVQQKTRIEIANNPGTPDQDAFNGALGNVFIRHSTSFPTRCTITVDGQAQTQGGLAFPPPPGSANPYEWQLPTNDSNGAHPIQRLHTLDLYFWAQGDADQFLDLAEQYLSHAQIDTDRHPSQPPETNATSTIVQQLENVAITDPAYQNGQTRNSHTETSVVSPAPVGLPPPPPVSAPTASQSHQYTASTASASPLSVEQKRDSAQFTPLPYNPAAPAAPEPIKHREKTPPPPDAADGNGLAAAVAADNGVPYTDPTQVSGAGYAAPPPPPGQAQVQAPAGLYAIPGGYASPPPSAGLPRPGSFPPQSQAQAQAPIQSPPASVSSYLPQSQASVQSPPAAPSYPPTYLPQQLYGQPQQQQQQQPQPQIPQPQQQPSFYGTQVPSIGGYSTYSYDQTSQQQQQNPYQIQQPQQQIHHQSTPSLTGPSSASEYSIHNTMYRPTEAEAGSHLQDHAKLAMQNPGQSGRPRKLEDSASRVESSVNRFLKKLEKKL